ncbi:MAG: hypothetical protein WCL08_03310 [Verrucomicrobiota bacterium]
MTAQIYRVHCVCARSIFRNEVKESCYTMCGYIPFSRPSQTMLNTRAEAS